MSDIIISPLVETWRVANLTNKNFGLPGVPGLTHNTAFPKKKNGEPQWFDALEHTTSEILAASIEFASGISSGSIGSEGYKHTHEGSYDIIAEGGSLPDATNWHSHSGLDILTGGVTSNADALHTHDGFTTTSEVDTAISLAIGYIELDVYVTKAGSITQLSDITSEGSVIEASIVLAHAQDHTILEHLDDIDPFTIANFRKLLDGSNADCLHIHSGGGGTFDGEHNDLDGLNDGDYIHLTVAEKANFTTLTDGSNADALHIHDIISAHNDLTGLQGGDPDEDEFYHLDYVQFIGLTGGPSFYADDLHNHDFPTNAFELPLGPTCDAGWEGGLFAWTAGTLTSCAIDDINEVLSSLAPSSPPFIADRGANTGIDRSSSGVAAYITWSGVGAEALAGYANVDGIGSNPPVNGLVDFDGSFAESSDRGGVINATSMDVTGKLNEDVIADTGTPNPAYTVDAFAQGDISGSNYLILELNGVEFDGVNLHNGILTNNSTIYLTDSAAQDTRNSTNSGMDVSAEKQVVFPGGDLFDSYYRDGDWKVDSDDMANGWNYVRILHYIGGSLITASNYVDWVVDDDTTDTTYSTPVLDNLIMTGSEYLSGVRYYTDGTADYDVVISSAFRNTYFTGNTISYNCTNGAIDSESQGTSGGDETLDVTIVDANFEVSSGRKLDATIDVKASVNRVFNGNEGNDNGATSLASISGLLMDDQISGAGGENDLAESFNAEGYRMHTGIVLTNINYGSGTDASDYDWDSAQSLLPTNANYDDGLLQYNGALRYPTQGVLGGDFTKGGSGCEEGYADNPDYTGAVGNRVYLRYFYVGSGKQNFTFSVGGGTTTFVSVAAEPSGNNVTFELLAPNTTQDAVPADPPGTVEFKDCNIGYTNEGAIGCRTSDAGTAVIGTSSWVCTLGGRATSSSGNSIVVRITASSSWTGNISSLSVAV